ncbi:MAG: ATP-binding protein [Armatimonadota bacterium]|nr:ATP-binding protein [Armatimonadota bacterium]MDW8144499.1 ATP-binding protein [Armatimonadota bacterium]
MRLFAVPFSYDESLLRETKPYRATVTYLRKVCQHNCLALLEGEPGVGKTFGALAYARRNNIPFITVVERVLLEKAPGRFFKAMVSEITGYEPTSLWDAIDRLYEWASNGRQSSAIFLDEAQWLTGKALDVFRRLHDFTGLTIVFIGHQGELSKLFARYPQAADRVVFRFAVPHLSLEDIRTLHPDLDEEVRQSIYEMTNGNFRRVVRLMGYVHGYAQQKGISLDRLTVSDVRAIAKLVVLGD